jgi:uncharacterized protein YutE (UPF0331/DUF86 family)
MRGNSLCRSCCLDGRGELGCVFLGLAVMKSRQIRRDRPNLETAHQFFREGSFSVEPNRHYLSGKEREAELTKISDELRSIVKRQFPRTRNLEYAVLKAHLIIEHALSQYIQSYATTYVDMKALRFSFSQKLEIAYLLGFGAHDPILLPTVERLNKIRNQIVHTFVLDRSPLDEIIQINSEEYKDLKSKDDVERIRYLRWICLSICGRVAGQIIGTYVATVHLEQEGSDRPDP